MSLGKTQGSLRKTTQDTTQGNDRDDQESPYKLSSAEETRISGLELLSKKEKHMNGILILAYPCCGERLLPGFSNNTSSRCPRREIIQPPGGVLGPFNPILVETSQRICSSPCLYK